MLSFGECKQEKSVFSDTEVPILASSSVSHILHSHNNPQLSFVSVSSVPCCFLLLFIRWPQLMLVLKICPNCREVWHSSPGNALQRWPVLTFLLGKISPKRLEICESLTEPLPACWPLGLHHLTKSQLCSVSISGLCPSIPRSPSFGKPLSEALQWPLLKTGALHQIPACATGSFPLLKTVELVGSNFQELLAPVWLWADVSDKIPFICKLWR